MIKLFPVATLFFWLLCSQASIAFSTGPPPTKVVVTGASGKTGRLVFEALLEQRNKFEPRALVRSEKSAKALRKLVPETGLDQIVICDIANDLNNDGSDSPSPALEGCEAMIICTSAMPVINKLSLLKAFLKGPVNFIRGKKFMDFRSLKFDWKAGQYPEKVDYQGQKAQIDLAIKLGMKHVIIVGSMGGSDPENFLNVIGKRKQKDGTMTGNGDILLWKRKAEMYLTENSDQFESYTIIHPGGLKDDPAGQNQYVMDVDDVLIENKENRSIARADVAKLCVAALTAGKGQKVALDVVTKPVAEGESVQTAEQALEAFLEESKVYNYA